MVTKKIIIALFVILSNIIMGFSQSVDCFVTKKFKATIFPSSYVFKSFDSIPRFTPTRAEILETEKALARQIKSIVKAGNAKKTPFVIKDRKRIYRHLNCFNRQYFGYFNLKGEKILYIHAYYTGTWLDKLKYDMDSEDCLTEYNGVFDGGASIWGIEFNLNTKTFLGFGTNGYA
jgi:hypothetical protein